MYVINQPVGDSSCSSPCINWLIVYCCLPLQLIHEYRVLLLMGRTLVYPQTAANSSLAISIQYRAEEGRVRERQVQLLFPATARTVLRLMQAWWEVKVGFAVTVV